MRPAASLLPSESVRRVRLANGLTILARQERSAPVVAIVTWVRAGYFDEPDDRVGISHALEHMYFKGTTTRGVGEIARATKAAGGYLNAGTIYDHTHYYTVLPSSGFAAGLEVQADAYANSVIDAGELKRELEVIIEETKRKSDSAGPFALETMFATLHDRHRIRRWRMGREAELRALTRHHLLEFYRTYYRPSNTVLAIVGDVDPDVAIAEATRRYGGLTDAVVPRQQGPQEDAPPTFRTREWEGDIAQTELVFGWRTPALDHPDTPALDLLATVLAGGRASRLVRATRDRRLVSSIQAYDYTPTEIGVFVVHASARPERAAEAARAIHDQLKRVRDGEITAPEIERARTLMGAQWLRRLESADGQANFLGAWELLGDWSLGVKYQEAVVSCDASQLAAVASRWLDPDAGTIVAYRPRGAAALGTDAAAVRAMLDSERVAPLEAAPAVTKRPHPSGAEPTRVGVTDGVHVFRTADGVPILVRPRPGTTLAYVGCFVSGGVISEEVANGGVSTLMARTALRGTARRSATRLAEDAELLGGTPTASVGTEAFQWTMGVPVDALAGAAELLADLVLQPTFPAEGLEAERAIAIAALGALRDDMYRQPMRLAAEIAWPGHPYGRSTLGTEESVRAVTPAQLRAWHSAHVLAAPLVLAVVGDVEPVEAATLLAAHFGALRFRPLPPVPHPRWPEAFSQRVETRDKAQTALSLFFEGPSRYDRERFAAELLGGVASGLGGRFFEELRDRQSLAYTVLARPYARRAGGTFAAYIATSPNKEEQARVGLLNEFAKFCTGEVTAAEIERARTYAVGAWQIRQSSGAAVLSDLADAWLHDALEELASYPADLAGVTPESMRAVAERWFKPERRVEGIVRGVSRLP